ncbi:unnamed protein product [Amoebophrya sp. A25]|nr:unnamed protein product [Amoebophrya sp. A25]|eukprot:GSA25T00001481001.1
MPVKALLAPVFALMRLQQGGTTSEQDMVVQQGGASLTNVAMMCCPEEGNGVASSSSPTQQFLAPYSTAEAKIPYAAELRRWNNLNCSGPEYEVLNQDKMNECVRKIIPAPGSIRVQYESPTLYSSFHFQHNLFCGGQDKTKIGDFAVGECTPDTLLQSSQKREWVDKKEDLNAKKMIKNDEKSAVKTS